MKGPKGVALDTPGVYQISIQGYLDTSLSDHMQGVDIQVQELPDAPPISFVTGRFVDQAALAGVLSTLYDLGYPLLKVELLETWPERT